MAIYYLQSQIAFQAAAQYCQVVNWWRVGDAVEPNLFRAAKLLVEGMAAPSAGDPYLEKLAGILSEDTFISSVKARVVEPAGTMFMTAFAAADWPGTFSGDLAAQQVSTYIKWVPENNAGYHGGNFYPGVSEDALDANRFTEDFKVAVSDFMTAHIAGIQTTPGTFEPMLVKQTGPGFGKYLINGGLLSMTAGTQRRRLTPV